MPSTSTVQMFYIGNFADMDTDETDADNENPNVILGTYDDLVLAQIDEVDVDDDNIIHDDEYYTGDYLSYDTGAGVTNVALDNSSLYNADILLGDGSTISVTMLAIQAANGDVFISEYPAEQLDDLSIQSITLVSPDMSFASGIYQGESNLENVSVVCFMTGTLIETSEGERPVETLRPGDLVQTLDHGLQPIRWVHSDDCPLDTAAADAKPVLIAKGALGQGRPGKDLIVSPQHRTFVGGGGQLEQWFKTESLVPSKSLTGLPGIRHMQGKKTVTWVHFACDRHEIVLANGCLSESLLLGPMVVNGLSRNARQTLARLYGPASGPDSALNGPAARPCLKVGQVRRHIARRRKEQRDQTAVEIAKWDADLTADRLALNGSGFAPTQGKPRPARLAH